MRRHILYVSVVFILLFAVTYVEAVEISLFEKTYVRRTGSPITESDTFTGIDGLVKIRVTNGSLEDADYEMVSSSMIVLNGEVIIGASNFNQNVRVIEVEENLSEGINTIEVTLKGKPGGTLTIQIFTEATNADLDGDGFTVNQGDCNDNDSSINPAAEETCDGVDNNCNSQIDEGVKTTYYNDFDSDGYGNSNVTTDACEQPLGYVTDNTDCDDTNNTVNPGATEIPNNNIDDDCNPLTPDDVSVTDISITTPIDLSTINSSNIIVKGTINTSAGEIGIKVSGILAEIVGNEFVANDIFLELGENTLTAVATDKDGNTSTDSITVYTNDYQNLVSLSANKTSGVSPLDVRFSIDTQISNPITSYEMDYDGDGTIDQTIVDLDNASYTYNQTGIYYPTITVTDDQSSQYTDTVAITILSLDEMDVFFKERWEDLRTSLISGNIDSAVALFDEGFREVYREQLTELSSILSTIGNELGYLRFVAIGDNRAEYEIIVTREGVTYSYFLLFVRNQDGLWNIRAF